MIPLLHLAVLYSLFLLLETWLVSMEIYEEDYLYKALASSQMATSKFAFVLIVSLLYITTKRNLWWLCHSSKYRKYNCKNDKSASITSRHIERRFSMIISRNSCFISSISRRISIIFASPDLWSRDSMCLRIPDSCEKLC